MGGQTPVLFYVQEKANGGVEVDLLLNSLDYFKLSVYGTSSV